MRTLPLVLFLVACKGGHLDIGGDTDGDTAGTTIPDDTDRGDTDGTTHPDGECPDADYPGSSVEINDQCAGGGNPGDLAMQVEWDMPTSIWNPTYNQVMSQPIVIDLIGDATPEIVFMSYDDASWDSKGCLRGVYGDGSGEIFSRVMDGAQGTGGIAAGDLDGDGSVEIVIATHDGVIATDAYGQMLWTGTGGAAGIYGISDTPSIADLDGDDSPEVIVGSAIFSAQGDLLAVGEYGRGGAPVSNGNSVNVGTCSVAIDLDDDGDQEVVTGNAAYDLDGTALWHTSEDDGYPAVADFDGDGDGEIALGGGGRIRLMDTDGTELWSLTIPGCTTDYYGGPPVIADFDGDGTPDIGADCGSQYTVVDAGGNVMWQTTVQDGSSGNTASSAFDFDGDGAAEVVYADELTLWVLDGTDGSVRMSSDQHSSGTWLEYPVLADVDNDGQVEIVVPNNGDFTGITVFGTDGDPWRPGPATWNEYGFDAGSIHDDGSVPPNRIPGRSFRAGDGGISVGGADLAIELADSCEDCGTGVVSVWVAPVNHGSVDVPADANTTIDVVAVVGGQEIVLDNLPIHQAIHAGRREPALRVDVTSIDASILDAVTVRIHSDAPDCDRRNDELTVEGPFCTGE
jgi:hypothetical protein